MYLQLKKIVRSTSSAVLFSGLLVTAASTSLMAHADATLSMASGKDMSMDHMDMDHKQMKMTGNQDYDFAMMMKMHHEKGVKMAQKELDKGKNPEMRAAAQKIIDAQKKEIADFDKWLAEHPQKAK